MKKFTNCGFFLFTGMLLSSIITILSYLSKDRNSREEFETYISQHPFSQRSHSDNNAEGRQPDRPDLAKMQDYLRTIDPAFKRPTPLVLLGINNHTAQLRDGKVATSSTFSLSGTGSLSSNTTWVERGPKTIAGRTRAFMFDPNDPTATKAWAGGVSGGLWYNLNVTDPNSSWTKVDDFWDNLAISAITYDPTNPSVFYVATGEFESIVRGGGIWKTTDAGMNWSRLVSTENFLEIRDIVVRNENGTPAVYAAVWPGFGQDNPTYEAGLFRSVDGGATWEQTLPFAFGSSQYTNLPTSIKIGSDNMLYVGSAANTQAPNSKSSIYISNTGLTGSWTRVDSFTDGNLQFTGQIQLACAESNPSVLYAAIEDKGAIGGIFKSSSFGKSWSKVSLPKAADISIPSSDFTRGQAWWDLTVAVHPIHPDTCLIGGIDLYQTYDGGASWTQISKWSNNSNMNFLQCSLVHADQHNILYRPGFPNEVIATNDGGVYYCSDLSSAAFSDKFTRVNLNYNVTQFYTAALHPSSTDFMLAGAQDNGTQKFTNTGFGSTVDVYGGDGGMCFIDQLNPMYQIVSYVYNNIGLSTDGGNTFNISLLSDDATGNFINVGDYDSKLKILYTARTSSSVYKVSNVTSSPIIDSLKITLGSMASALRVAPSSNLYVGTQAGRLFRISNSNSQSPAIAELTGSNFPIGSISCISFGATEDQILVTFFNYGIASIWESRDGGSSWINREGDLPNMPVRWAEYHPQNFDQVYLATELGVWSTDDITSSAPNWNSTNGGLANVRTDMLRIRESEGTIMASTHGRGVFTAILPSNLDQTITFATIPPLYYGNPAFFVNAKSSSGLPISSYTSSDPSILSITNGVARITGVGPVSITAIQNGTNYFKPASATINLIVNKGTQIITFNTLSDKGIDSPKFALRAKSSVGLPVSYTSSDQNVIEINGDTAVVKGFGYAIITANQPGDNFYGPATSVDEIQKIKREQTISFDNIPSTIFNDNSFVQLKAIASSELPVNFSTKSNKIAITGDTATLLAEGSVTINAYQTGNDDYFPAPTVFQTLCINPPKPVATVTPLNNFTRLLSSSSINGNQWFSNNKLLTDSINQSILVKETGNYSVQVEVDNCFSMLSDPVSVTITNVTNNETTYSISANPNPTQSMVNISLNNYSQGEPAEINIYDMTGQMIYHVEITGEQSPIVDLSHFAASIYIVKVRQGARLSHTKVLKL